MNRDINLLISELTLEEKAGLCSGEDYWKLKAVERLNIPSVRLCDGTSGLRLQTDDDDHLGVNASVQMVSFPAPCATAASFDRDLLEALGKALGEECQSKDVSVILGPALNIKRSPLCGRNFEYFSEDPYLTGELAAAKIRGIQSMNIGACPKHFACNNQETWRMWADSQVDERTLREIYLTGFEIAVKSAKPWTMMCSYNRVNGIHASEHHQLLTEFLRDEWGFDGFVMSDWGAVSDRAAALAAGLDLEMPGCQGITDIQLVKAVKDGVLDEAALDKAVERILNIVFRYADNRIKAEYDVEEHHRLAVQIEQESAVLLKNEDNILPLNDKQNVVFVGEYAHKPRIQGGGSAHVNPFKVSSALDAAKNIPGVSYSQGFPAEGDQENEDWVKAAVEAAKQAQTVVIFAGLPDSYESECWDRPHMRLPDCQNKLIESVCKVQSNVVVVLHNGSPIEMPWLGKVKAVLELYAGGQGVGEAAINLLYGKANPCGKLPESFPHKFEDNPSYLNFPGDGNVVEYREGVFVGYRYYDTKKMDVLFPFGHGLSYTSFSYSNLRLDKTEMQDSDNLTVRVDITNNGILAGKEIVQLYVSDTTGTLLRPVKELKGFEKLELDPGETKTARFTLDKRSFAWYSTDINDWYCASGEYRILIGASSRDIRMSGAVKIVSSVSLPFKVTMNTLMENIWRNPNLADEAEKLLRKGSPKIEEFMSGNDEISLYLREELMELPFHAIRGLYCVSHADLEAIIERLNAILKDTD